MERTLYARSNRKRFKFVVRFDEYGIIDTISRSVDGGPPQLIAANSPHAKAILFNAAKVRAGLVAPVGFTWSP